uniref:Uncharacterized protein n=1 Tax=Globodera pallida TaxID=36090 RepID=A0A183CQW9_GLOPA
MLSIDSISYSLSFSKENLQNVNHFVAVRQFLLRRKYWIKHKQVDKFNQQKCANSFHDCQTPIGSDFPKLKSQSTKEKILKIDNNKRKQTFVAKAKSSEFVQEEHLDNKKEQQFKFSFMEYWTTVNVYLGYKGATYEYLGRY